MGRIVKLNPQILSTWSCCNCGSDQITDRFRSTNDPMIVTEFFTGELYPIDGDDYQFHNDCKVCLECGYWDFVEAFYNPEIYADMECRACGKETTQKQEAWDIWDGLLLLRCLDCNTKTNLRLNGEGRGIFEVLD